MLIRSPDEICAEDPCWLALFKHQHSEVIDTLKTILTNTIKAARYPHQPTSECSITTRLLFNIRINYTSALTDLLATSIHESLCTSLPYTENLSLLCIKTLISESFLSIYREISLQTNPRKLIHYFFENSPGDILELGIHLRELGVTEITLHWDLLSFISPGPDDNLIYYQTHIISQEQYLALQNAFQHITTLSLSIDTLGLALSSEQWRWLGGLFKNLRHFKLVGKLPIMVSAASLAGFNEGFKNVTTFDLENIYLYNRFDDSTDDLREAIIALMKNTMQCEQLKLRSLITYVPYTLLEDFFSGPNPTSLSLSNIWLSSHQTLINLCSASIIRSPMLILRNNALHLLEENQWIKLCQGLKHVKHIDLSHNHLANCANIQRLAFVIKQLSQFEWVNLNHNNLEDLDDDEWEIFCEALSAAGLKNIAPMTTLPDDRRIKVETIIKHNCARSSLKSLASHFLFHHPIAQTLEKLPNIPRDLLEEAEMITTLNQNITH